MSRLAVALVFVATLGCSEPAPAPSGEVHEETCTVVAEGQTAPDFLRAVPCRRDFDALASVPLDTSIPGAQSVKVVLDQLDGDALYFQNSQKY